MAATYRTASQLLHEINEGCCPLCKSKLPAEGIMHTPDFLIFVRDGYVAQFTAMEAAVLRVLFKEATNGFRLSRDRLLAQMYSGADAPLNAANVLATALTHMRSKLLPLGMGVISDNGIVNLLFTPPGYKPRRRT